MKEKIPEIKFSHEYMKFEDIMLPFKAVLLQCFRIHKSELSNAFIAYDTTYDGGQYELPNTELIVLLLFVPEREVIDDVVLDSFCFTTIRRFTPQKFRYYKSLEGKTVRVVRT